MFYISILIILLPLITSQSWGQDIPPDPPGLKAASQRVATIPKQLTLDKAEEILLQNNLAIIAARYGVDIARAQRLAASLRPNPTITLGAEQLNLKSVSERPLSDTGMAANPTYTLRFDQVLERGNKRKLRTRAAESKLQAAEAQVLDTIRQQIFQLKQSFYTAVLARENLRVVEENLDTIDKTERLIRLQVDMGSTAEGDLIKFQANKVQYQHDIASFKLSYQQSVRDLLNLIGVKPSNVVENTSASESNQISSYIADLDVVGDLNVEPQTLTISLDELRREAIENRPDIIVAQYNLDAAQYALDLAYAMRHRDVDLGLEYQRIGSDNTFGVVVSVPLFLFNNFQGDIGQALAQLEQAKAQLTQARLQVITDVDKAYQAYQLNQQTLKVYTSEALAKAKESFHIAEVSYKEG
ncbi:MAG: hypothetical protein C4291_12110, partial [Candidatus Dadabacteria bacterium]